MSKNKIKELQVHVESLLHTNKVQAEIITKRDELIREFKNEQVQSKNMEQENIDLKSTMQQIRQVLFEVRGALAACKFSDEPKNIEVFFEPPYNSNQFYGKYDQPKQFDPRFGMRFQITSRIEFTISSLERFANVRTR